MYRPSTPCNPLITAGWQRFVPAEHRGQRFGRLVVLVGASGLATNLLWSWLFDHYALGDMWRWVMVALALCAAGCAWACWRQPAFRLRSPAPEPQAQATTQVRARAKAKAKTKRQPTPNPLRCLRHLWQHPLFGYCSGAWMLIGFANLATIPLRVDWLADDAHGLSYSPSAVLWLTLIIPAMCAMLSAPIWGRLFDRLNFIILRIAVNSCFMISIWLFFEPSWWLQLIGAITFGFGVGGGNIAWSLWVTAFAPPKLVGEYQACHTFLTGLRGIVGPSLAYAIIADWSIRSTTWWAVGLIACSTLLFAGIISYGRRDSNGSRLQRQVR